MKFEMEKTFKESLEKGETLEVLFKSGKNQCFVPVNEDCFEVSNIILGNGGWENTKFDCYMHIKDILNNLDQIKTTFFV